MSTTSFTWYRSINLIIFETIEEKKEKKVTTAKQLLCKQSKFRDNACNMSKYVL